MLDDLKIWLDNKPFVPFRILVTSGSSYEVTSRFQVAVGRTQFSYYFPRSDRKAMVRIGSGMIQAAALTTTTLASSR